MVINCCYLERENYEDLKFHRNNYNYFNRCLPLLSAAHQQPPHPNTVTTKFGSRRFLRFPKHLRFAKKKNESFLECISTE